MDLQLDGPEATLGTIVKRKKPTLLVGFVEYIPFQKPLRKRKELPLERDFASY